MHIRLVKPALIFIALFSISSAHAVDLNWSGFFNTGAAKLIDDENTYRREVDDDVNFDFFTSLGLQVNAEITEKASFVGQLSAKGTDAYDINADWAFAKYDVTPTTTVRAGRMRIPVYKLSDHINVGYTYLTSIPPFAVYGVVPFENMSGIDLTKNFLVNDVATSLHLAYGSGSPSFTVLGNPVTMPFKNFISAALRLEYDSFDVRLGAAATKIRFQGSNPYQDFTNGFSNVYGADGSISAEEQRYIDRFDTTKETDAKFYSLAVDYNNHNFQVASELVFLYIDSGIPSQRAYYTTAGYQIGDWVPFISFANVASIDDAHRQLPVVNGSDPNQVIGIPQVNQLTHSELDTDEDTLTFGVRWDFDVRTALKAEVQRIKAFDGTRNSLAAADEKSTYMTVISVNFVF